jgi:hypothetical protein
MPKYPLISIPLDIPDIRILQIEITKAGELIFTAESTLTSTSCQRCGTPSPNPTAWTSRDYCAIC